MTLGKSYWVKPVFTASKDNVRVALPGKCVYIHPKRRYGVLEFEGVAGKVRESFWPEQLTGQNMVSERRKRNGQ